MTTMVLDVMLIGSGGLLAAAMLALIVAATWGKAGDYLFGQPNHGGAVGFGQMRENKYNELAGKLLVGAIALALIAFGMAL